jgi:hypothetical protein
MPKIARPATFSGIHRISFSIIIWHIGLQPPSRMPCIPVPCRMSGILIIPPFGMSCVPTLGCV